MKNKKIILFFLCLWISILISCNQRDTKMDISMANTSLNMGVDAGIDYFYMQVDSDNDSKEDNLLSEDETGILYYCEESIMDNPVFSDFLNNEKFACDNVKDTEDYLWGVNVEFYNTEFKFRDLIHRYLEAEFPINELQIYGYDLNNDGSEELIVQIARDMSRGILHVFHEQDGKLYVWEALETYSSKSCALDYYDNGIIGHKQNGIFIRFNSEGKWEYVLKHFNYWDEQECIGTNTLHLYENGIETVYMECEFVMLYGSDEIQITEDNQKIKEQIDSIYSEFMEENGEAWTVYSILYGDGDYITIEELCD